MHKRKHLKEIQFKIRIRIIYSFTVPGYKIVDFQRYWHAF